MARIVAKYRTPHVRPHAASLPNGPYSFLTSVVTRQFGAVGLGRLVGYLQQNATLTTLNDTLPGYATLD